MSGARREWGRFDRRSVAAIFATLCVLSASTMLWSASSFASRGHVFGGAFGRTGSGEGEFIGPSGIAVNEASGSVYVVDKGDNRVERFSAAGAYEAQFDGASTPATSFAGPDGIAVDTSCHLHKPVLTEVTVPTCNAFDPSDGDVYVVDTGNEVVDKFSAAGTYIGQLTKTVGGASLHELFGVSVDSKGTLWVYAKGHGTGANTAEVINFTNTVANESIAARELGILGFPEAGFAVDAADDLYVHQNRFFTGTNIISKFSTDGSLLIGALDEEQPTGLAVELPTGDLYVDEVTKVARFTVAGAPIEDIGVGHLEGGGGVAVNSSTEDIYVAEASTNAVDIFTPEPPGSPTIEAESVSGVSSNSTKFSAQINPRGSNTEFSFEYGQTQSYGSTVPLEGGSIGSGFEIQDISTQSLELKPHTTYHFRVVARNSLGSASGSDHIFTTQADGGAQVLLDGRSWELVSPPNKRGASIEHIFNAGIVASSSDGDALTYLASSPTESELPGYANQVQVLSRRAPGGWSSEDIATAHEAPTGLSIGHGQEYRFFSEDLSLGLVQPRGEFSPLSPHASERTPYVRTQSLCEDQEAFAGECYVPLVTSIEGYRDVPISTKFGGGIDEWEGAVGFVGATTDLKKVVIQSKAELTPITAESDALYEWSADEPQAERLKLVSALPAGKGGPAGVEAVLGSGGEGTSNAISSDGSHVFWSEAVGGGHLYLRNVIKGETVRLDIAQPGASAVGKVDPEFQTARSDGTAAFFTDEQQLIPEAGKSGTDLYECDVIESHSELKCVLSDLTPESASEAADVQGVVGASDDDSYLYVVATGVLSTEQNAHGERALPGEDNLYLLHYDESEIRWNAPRFVASLSGGDRPDWVISLARHTARVSSDGRYVAFMSNRSLTGYDNIDARSGKPDEEVFLYDADLGKIVCASCDPTGGKPVGAEYNEELLFAGQHVWPEHMWLAANIPGWTPYENDTARYQSRYLSDEGRLFFNSDDALASGDVDDTEDVYEYEPVGVGGNKGCTSGNPTFSERSDGCIGLVSSGLSTEESVFLDASRSGDDVFFLTTSKLAPADFDTSLDVYDAHVCTPDAPCVEPEASSSQCSTIDSCRSVSLTPPTALAPPSAMLLGVDKVVLQTSKPAPVPRPLTRAQKLARSLRQCVKKKHKQRTLCERNARKRYGPKKPHGSKTKKKSKR